MRKARADIRDFVISIKENSPCMDCNNYYPYYVMQFDHVRGDKIDKINRLIYTSSKSKVIEEIEKCDLVCGNCHAIRTHKRQFDITPFL